MSFNTKVYFILSLALLSQSCNKNRQDPEFKTFSIQSDEYRDFLLSQLVDTLFVVPLETKSNALIGSISKVETTNDLIFVLDNSIAEALFIYDWNGNLVKSFHGTGEGPMEFLRVGNFYLNEKRKSIFIQDNSLGKIVEFSFDGQFISEKKINPEFWIYDLIPVGDQFISVKTKNDKSGMFIDLLDSELKLKRILVDLQDDINVFGGLKGKYFWKGVNDEIYFKQTLGNTLYLFKDLDNIEIIKLAFDKNIWVPTFSPIHPQVAYSTIQKDNLNAISDEFLDFDDFFLLNFINGSNLNGLIVQKEDGVSYSIRGLKNDLDGLFKSYPGVLPINSNPNQFVLDVDSEDFASQLSKGDYDKSYFKIFNNVKIDKDSNPILFIYRNIYN